MSDRSTKLRVLLLAGGQSEEHDVSLHSAASVLRALPKDRFEVVPVVISREGRWLGPAETSRLLGFDAEETSDEVLQKDAARKGSDGLAISLTSDTMSECLALRARAFDVVFPLLHGPQGEDGTVQGLLQLAGIPFVGSGVLGSAVCMDKVMMKSVLAAHGVPQVEFELVTKAQRRDIAAVRKRLERLGLPLFVKPANLGSSVGIVKVQTLEGLEAALEEAFRFDRRIIVEAAAGGGEKPRELEIGLLGNDEVCITELGEIVFEADFYDYETKYTPGTTEYRIPAEVPREIAQRARSLALEAYRALDCAGLARIDFFYLPKSGELLLNEVNTMPGFTATSMYPKLFEAAGISYGELAERLIELALERR